MKNNQLNNSKNYYWICGKYSVNSAILNKRRKIIKLLINQKKPNSFIHELQKNILISEKKVNIELVSIKKIERLFHNSSHQGIAAKIERYKMLDINEYIACNCTKKKNISVLLSNINDPQNFGAIIRSAVAFDIIDILINKNNSCKETQAVSKVSSGGIEKVKIYNFGNLSNSINLLKKNGWFIVGLDGEAKLTFHDISTNKLKFTKVLIIMGSEFKGLSELIKKKCDIVIKIPINKVNIDSLNVASAASIAFYELNNLLK